MILTGNDYIKDTIHPNYLYARNHPPQFLVHSWFIHEIIIHIFCKKYLFHIIKIVTFIWYSLIHHLLFHILFIHLVLNLILHIIISLFTYMDYDYLKIPSISFFSIVTTIINIKNYTQFKSYGFYWWYSYNLSVIMDHLCINTVCLVFLHNFI